ncbi:MAG: HD domain-containing protein [Verrucomicrobia bacterium]|nr:MAG: HD domain-containing protein [Verrucomicrobiota bacterium]
MNLPEPLARAIAALTEIGRPLLVGGCVRDWLLGLTPKDFDVEVFGVDWEKLVAVLRQHGPVNLVGKSFGVAKVRLGGVDYDFSLPRREVKVASGHRGFAVEPDPAIDPATAALRRDFTINAIYFDPASGEVLDPLDGRRDLRAGILRHTGPAFAEDPLRVLRAFQFAARFDFEVAPETIELCRTMLPTFAELPVERVWGEWEKWSTTAQKPSRGLQVLKQTGWLTCFPELAALDGLPQEPAWHPEGDVLTHTGHCLDALVQLEAWRQANAPGRRILSFAVLCHDLGKAETTTRAERHGVMRWVSPGHDRAGGPLAERFLERIGSPHDLRKPVRQLVECHHVHQSWPLEGPSAAAVRRLARKLSPASIDQLTVVMEADHRGRPPLLSEETALRIERLRAKAAELSLQTAPPPPLLRGRDLIRLGLKPSPEFSRILRAAYEAQLDGAFHTHEEAVAWVQSRFDLDTR